MLYSEFLCGVLQVRFLCVYVGDSQHISSKNEMFCTFYWDLRVGKNYLNLKAMEEWKSGGFRIRLRHPANRFAAPRFNLRAPEQVRANLTLFDRFQGASITRWTTSSSFGAR